MKPPDEDVFDFGPFRVDARQRLLTRHGVPIPILPKSFDVLVALARRSGQLVDKEAMLTAVWRDTAVEQNSLAKAISDVRRALGEDPRAPRFIVTVAGRGYRFAEPVRIAGAVPAVPTAAVLPFNDLGGSARGGPLSIRPPPPPVTRPPN